MIRGPQSRMAPKPRRRTSRSPPRRNVSGSATEVCGDGEIDLEAALCRCEVDPFDDSMGALTRRTEQNRRDPGPREQRRVGPERDADDLSVTRVAAHELDDRLFLVDLKRGAREHDARLAVDVSEEIPNLAFDLRHRFARHGPPLSL